MIEIILETTPFLNWTSSILNFLMVSGLPVIFFAICMSVFTIRLCHKGDHSWVMFAMFSAIIWGAGVAITLPYFNLVSFKVI